MKLGGLLAALLLVSPLAAQEGRQAQSRFGKLEIRSAADGPEHRLLLKGKAIYEVGGESPEIRQVLQGADRDYVILVLYSGGIACPAQVVIAEVGKSGLLTTSREFGSCSDRMQVKKIKGGVVIEMPAYTPHPDLLSPEELKRRDRTTEVYTWSGGKLTRKTVITPRRKG